MEFVEVMKITSRMCSDIRNCYHCPLAYNKNKLHIDCSVYMQQRPQEAEIVLIEWRERHPLKTLAQKFKDIFPDSSVGDYPNICPAMLGKSFTGPDWKLEDHCGNGCKSCWEFRVPDDA